MLSHDGRHCIIKAYHRYMIRELVKTTRNTYDAILMTINIYKVLKCTAGTVAACHVNMHGRLQKALFIIFNLILSKMYSPYQDIVLITATLDSRVED